MQPWDRRVTPGGPIGVVASLWASRFVGTLLYGLAPHDPTTLLSAVVLLTVVAGLGMARPQGRKGRGNAPHLGPAHQ